MLDKTASYSASNVFPIKVVRHKRLMESILKKGKIPPLHVQLNPTNNCQFNCSFCSCSNRNKGFELSLQEIYMIMCKASHCGCEAVTITGGGEPLIHPKINEVINYISDLGIEIGVVTNGGLLKRLTKDTLKKITWVRVSTSDELKIGSNYWSNLKGSIRRGETIDWSFSHVILRKPNYPLIKKIIEFSNRHAFTHIRLVNDLLDLEGSTSMGVVKNVVNAKLKVDDNLVIYQDRKPFTHGSRNCWICLLKPVVTANGWIGPCCGWQYAHNPPTKDYDQSMFIGRAYDLDVVYFNQKPFDGSQCQICYYKHYNDLLESLKMKINHERFV